MSLYDGLTIPIIFFLLFVVVGIVYYEADTFQTTFSTYNASMSNTSQEIYNTFFQVHEYGQSFLNLTIFGVIFVFIYVALVLAAIVYAHPGYFVMLIFLAGGIVFAWYAMNQGITNILSISGIGSFFDPAKMSLFYVVRDNMYLLISLIVGAMIFALYFKGGQREGGV